MDTQEQNSSPPAVSNGSEDTEMSNSKGEEIGIVQDHEAGVEANVLPLAASNGSEDNELSKGKAEEAGIVQDHEANIEKIKYPKSVFFIISNEFCERFSYYGMRTVLVLYLTEILLYSETTSKILFHAFTFFVYTFPLLGATLADSWLGKFKTILYLSLVYAIGQGLLALTSADPLKIPQEAFTIVALLLIALGTGGIKPCVTAFGGDQFVLPQQELQLARYFSLFYFSINCGAMLSTFVTPILRNDVQCMERNSCYPLAFGVPGILMLLSVVIFFSGKRLYTIKKPKGNVFMEVVSCMWYAVTHKKTSAPVDHWLDRSEPKFGPKLVKDIKSLLKVLVIYIPLPVFWALSDQQGSGWTFQAIRMNGDIGFYTILPDQMQVINPLLILAFIPLFTYVIYPLFAKCGVLRTPLQRMVCGGFLYGIAFGASASLSLVVESTYPELPTEGEAQIRVYDTTTCRYTFSTISNVVPNGVFTDGYYENKHISVPDGQLRIYFTFTSAICDPPIQSFTMDIRDQTSYGVYVRESEIYSYVDDVSKSEDGYPLVRTLTNYNVLSITYTSQKKSDYSLTLSSGDVSLQKLDYVGKYNIKEFGNAEVEFKLGGTYTVLINGDTSNVTVITVTNPNSVHLLWQVIQYVILTAAEIMFSITGLEFSYSQAPQSMKSVVQACWLLTTALGNLLIVVVEMVQPFEKQSHLFFLYTGIMAADILLFMWLTVRYKYVSNDEVQQSDDSSLMKVEPSEDANTEDKKEPAGS